MAATITAWTRLLDVLFEDSVVGRCLVAPDGTILRANSEWLRSTGFSRDVVGEDVVALFPEVRDMSLALHARARAGHRVEVPRHAQTVNGRETWWEGSIDPVPMEGGTGLLITAREVSDAVLRTAQESAASAAELRQAAAERLAQDLDAMTRLHRLSTRYVHAADLPRALEEIVDVAIAITHADMGNLQLLDPATRRLKIAASRGHERSWLDFFESVAEGQGASCGAALQQGARAIVEDVATSPVFVGTPALEVQLRAGIRAVQSTPLVGSSGELVGMISTHYRTPHRPDERDLRLLDLLARQAADMIERVRSEAARRESEEQLRLFVEHAPAAVAMFDRDMRYLVVSQRFLSDFRQSSAGVIGRCHYDVFPEIPERWKEIHRRCLEGAVESCDEEPFPRADGSLDWVRWEIRPWHTAAGAIGGIILFSEVITARKATETRLAHVASFPEKNPNPIVEATAGGRVTYANPSALRLFPGIREEGAAHPWLSGVVGTSIRDGDSMGERVVNVGDRFFFQVITHLPGQVVRTYGMDISERVRAEHALRAKEAELEAILERTPFMLTRCSRDLRYLYVSRAYAEMIGRAPDEVAGKPIVEIMGEKGLATIRPHVEAVLRGQRVEYETAVHFMGVGERRLQVIYTPEGDEQGQVIGWIGSIIDVTERRQAQEALRVANAQLTEANRRKTEFLAMLSHELRNPLAPIRTSLYVLDRSEPNGQEARRAKDVIGRQVGHLTRLVGDLFDVTRIARGKIELRRVELDLGTLVRRTAEDYRRTMQDRGLDLEVEPVGDGSLVVNGDETRLAQVFGNLLSNAAKFTPAGGRVTVVARAEGGYAVVRVRDTGPGVAPDVLPSVFEPFMQAKQTLARTEGGLGLGLALVRELVSLHGGEVNVASGSGGAEFTVRIPLAVGRERRAVPSAGRASAGAAVPHRRVLVVDDNEDAAESLAELVRMLGHVAEVAYDGPTAVRRAGEYHPDVVLCDIGLPGMDGYEVAHELRAARGRDVRLVAISGYAQPEDVARAEQAGFDAHLAKPCAPEQIARLLS